jgi:hypothetical protein
MIGILTLFFNGCVKVNDADVVTTDYRSLVKAVDLVDAGTQSISVIGTGSIASLAYEGSSTYIDLPAGSRQFVFAYGARATDTLPQPLTPYAKYTAFSYKGTSDAAVTYAFFFERYTYSGTVAFVSQNVLIRFINLSSDTTTFYVADTSASGLTSLTSTPYYQVPVANAANYFVLGSNSDTLVSSTSLPSEGRYSVVLYGSVGSLKSKLLKED